MEGGLWRSNRGSKKIRYLFFLLRKVFPLLFLFIACLLYLLRRDLRTLPSFTTIWEVLTMLRKQGWIVRSSALPHFPTATVAKSLQPCPTLYNPIDGSPPGSHVPGILQARTLDWVAISFSNAWKWTVKVKSLSRVQLVATLWTAAYQAPPSMGFSRQEDWSGVPLPSPLISLEQ